MQWAGRERYRGKGVELRVWLRFWKHGVVWFRLDDRATTNNTDAFQHVLGDEFKLPSYATAVVVVARRSSSKFSTVSPEQSVLFSAIASIVTSILLTTTSNRFIANAAEFSENIELECPATHRDQCARPWWWINNFLFAWWLAVLNKQWDKVTPWIIWSAQSNRRWLILTILRQHDAIRLKPIVYVQPTASRRQL